MCRILPAIDSLDQPLYHLEHHPETFRPQQCPHCGRCGVWRHGYYRRKADREGQDGVYLDPVPIPRFYCRHCQATCSRLPGCIAPRRWYSWTAQQTVLVVLLSGSSVRQAARMSRPGRHTIRRWWRWLEDRFSHYSFHLRSHFPELGRCVSQVSFWWACLRWSPALWQQAHSCRAYLFLQVNEYLRDHHRVFNYGDFLDRATAFAPWISFPMAKSQ